LTVGQFWTFGFHLGYSLCSGIRRFAFELPPPSGHTLFAVPIPAVFQFFLFPPPRTFFYSLLFAGAGAPNSLSARRSFVLFFPPPLPLPPPRSISDDREFRSSKPHASLVGGSFPRATRPEGSVRIPVYSPQILFFPR